MSERNSAPHQQIRDVGRGRELVGGRLRQPVAPERGGAQHARGGVEARLERVGRVEQVLLVFLHVLVVGERKRVQYAQQGGQMPSHARGLRPQQLRGVR